MNDEIGRNELFTVWAADLHAKFGAGAFYAEDGRVEHDIDAQAAGVLDEPGNEVRIELAERPAAGKHEHLDTRAHGDVSELERYEARPDESNPIWKHIEIEKVSAGSDVFLSGNAKRGWSGTARNHEELRFQLFTIGNESVGGDESANRVICVDSELLKGRLSPGRYRFGESAFEPHQRRPIEAWLSAYSPAVHSTMPVDELRRANENLLRVATAQCASSAVRLAIDDGHAPACLCAPVRCARAARPGAHDDQIVALHSTPLSRFVRPAAISLRWARLLRWTRHRTVRAKNTAVTRERSKHFSAVRALIEKLARIRWHVLLPLGATARAFDSRNKLDGIFHVHFALSAALA